MAVPKRKKSKSKRDKRRTHQKLTPPGLSVCPQCGEAVQPHHMCAGCGAYKGKTIMAPEE